MTRGVVAFALLLTLVALQRIVEALVSARRARRRPGATVAEGWGFVAMVAVHVGLVVIPLVEVVALDRPVVPPLALAAAAALVAATALRVWTLRSLGGAWNVRVLRPAPGTIVTHGPYRWIRHPNYLVVIVELAALPLLHTAWLSALALSAANGLVLARRIRVEERALATDPAWRAAMAGVPRLLPWTRGR